MKESGLIFESMMKEKMISIDFNNKKRTASAIIVPTITYANDTWLWNARKRSRVQVTEVSYLKRACGV